MLTLAIPSFVAGLLTFLAPCTLPLVPAYMAFVGGSSAKTKVFLNGLAFVLGFSTVFIILGLFAGTIGGFVAGGRLWFSRIGGILVIIFGLMMLDIISIPWLLSEKRLHIQVDSEQRGRYGFSFILGTIFGSGWTPCVGPVLGSVLVLAGSAATAKAGALLLGIFSLGLAIPFLLVALGVSRSQKFIDRHAGQLGFVTKLGGLIIVGLGILLLTGKMSLLVTNGYKVLQFIHYESLINYL